MTIETDHLAWIRSNQTEIQSAGFVIFIIPFTPFCLGWILDLNLVNLDGNLRNLTPESYSLHIPVAEQINQAEETHNTIPLQFTMEEETKHQLIFLDILITLIENGLIYTSEQYSEGAQTYRKIKSSLTQRTLPRIVCIPYIVDATKNTMVNTHLPKVRRDDGTMKIHN